ncbi:hypothetical protein P3X46_025019 [Hevea brasiliensis]|uniref:Protein kinase domain-containing protein n=1 Tax=Hevea brasiliensis TaxID=3981 RepID=A0ABQ9L6Y4_HEVBR|nr:probable LRR receptor-like serine/threonine-protein kinase At3g47570 [Hevea brasiliensis]KAJ9159513.1 hypothetical protein P3X46_025019 [Hevea brasiliensis]
MGSRLPYSLFCILHLFFCVLCLANSVAAAAGNETDRLALLHFKAKITNDPFGVLHQWNSSAHFCQWHSVTCGRRHLRVVKLELFTLKLEGSISPHIGNLSFLRVLDLQNNSLSKEIPSEIGHLRRLENLILYNNFIVGKIPSNISACSNLISFNIGLNQVVGEIPSALGSLLKLQVFAVNRNNLTGTIPSNFGNLSSLERFHLNRNNIGGTIPYTLGGLKNLRYFLLAVNSFSGEIPSSLFNFSSVMIFDVGSNEIQGHLPSNIGITLPNVEVLTFAFNQFSGSIPISISNATKLEYLQFPGNNFTGEVPSLEKLHRLQIFHLGGNSLGSAGTSDLRFLCSLINATNLKFLNMQANNFGGILPGCIANLSTNLESLAVESNMIFGSIPAGIGNFVNLKTLSVADNRISGNLPAVIGKLQKLEILFLSENKLSGEIPHSLGNLTLLTKLTLYQNNFQGIIPSSLGECRNLILLDLSSNNLTGSIPPQVFGLSSLSIYLALSQNSLMGALPFGVGNLKNLGELRVDQNLLSGEIPSSLGSCARLETLNMQGNFFQGSIPSSLSALRGLQVFDLSHNNLSGQIPTFLGSFVYLLNLNLSFNNFEGIVPIEGVFRNASATSVMGNINLCGGIPEFHLVACRLKTSTDRRLSAKARLIILVVAGLLGAILMMFSFFLLRLRKKSRAPALPSVNSLTRVSYQILLDATNGFSSLNLISVGGFGSVYKGLLGEGGPPIAVKVLNLQHHKAARSFIAECEVLKNIRHRNLVKVISACSSIDYQGNDFKALVYEFMVNGSLEDWLHPVVVVDGNHHEARKSLNLLQRLNIAIDIAFALEYLHHHCETTIVHCDLKPSNVLLDDELTGHVSDFGLAKLLLKDFNGSTTYSSSIGLRGTIGYAPPEYGQGGEASAYGDIYSYGILLLEMFTGKRPTNDMFKEDLNLHKLAKSALPDGVAEILDPIILERGEIERSINNTRDPMGIRTNRIMECLISIVGIGVACSVELPLERMNISDVAPKLCSIRNKLLRN